MEIQEKIEKAIEEKFVKKENENFVCALCSDKKAKRVQTIVKHFIENHQDEVEKMKIDVAEEIKLGNKEEDGYNIVKDSIEKLFKREERHLAEAKDIFFEKAKIDFARTIIWNAETVLVAEKRCKLLKEINFVLEDISCEDKLQKLNHYIEVKMKKLFERGVERKTNDITVAVNFIEFDEEREFIAGEFSIVKEIKFLLEDYLGSK